FRPVASRQEARLVGTVCASRRACRAHDRRPRVGHARLPGARPRSRHVPVVRRREGIVRPKWVPDPGWTGDWSIPDALRRPLSDKERGMLVAMTCGGMGPARLALALSGASAVAEVAGPLGERWRDALAHLRKLGARAPVSSD